MSLPFLQLDANSTEFDPESKYPVVSCLKYRNYLVLRTTECIKFKFSYLTFAGDRYARTQPRADGRDHEVREETDHFQDGKQCIT